MATVNMVSPWVEHYRKIEAFFADDNDVFVVYDNDKAEVKVYVADPDRASAIESILLNEIEFGGVKLSITVIPGNKTNHMLSIKKSLGMDIPTYTLALMGNPALSYIRTIEAPGNMPFTYIVFINKVVQYFRDDLSDIHRMASTLYENIARDIFKSEPGIFFNTDLPIKNSGDEE